MDNKKACRSCEGKGFIEYDCNECWGHGYAFDVKILEKSPDGLHCPKCLGTGFIRRK